MCSCLNDDVVNDNLFFMNRLPEHLIFSSGSPVWLVLFSLVNTRGEEEGFTLWWSTYDSIHFTHIFYEVSLFRVFKWEYLLWAMSLFHSHWIVMSLHRVFPSFIITYHPQLHTLHNEYVIHMCKKIYKIWK